MTDTVVGLGTSGSPLGGVVSVQGVVGGTPVPVSGAGSSASEGPIGAAAPADGTQIAGPDGAGNLRAPEVLNGAPVGTEYALLVRPIGGTAANASVGVNGAAAPASSTQIGGPNGAGNLEAAQVLAVAPVGTEEALVTRNIPSGTQPISVADNIVTGTIPSGGGGTGTVAVGTQGMAFIRLVITGIWTGTIDFEGLLPDGTWVAAAFFSSSAPLSTAAVSATANGQFFSVPILGSGFQSIRARGNTVSAGTANIFLEATAANVAPGVYQSLAPNGGGTAFAPWSMAITDSTNSTHAVAVKDASTAAAAADRSLVVALSPNSPLPAQAVAQTGTTQVGAVGLADFNAQGQCNGNGVQNIAPVNTNGCSEVRCSLGPNLNAANTGTVTFQGLEPDGATWSTIGHSEIPGIGIAGSFALGATADQIVVRIPCAGYQQVRVSVNSSVHSTNFNVLNEATAGVRRPSLTNASSGSGNASIVTPYSTTNANSTVAANAASVQLLAANVLRRGATLFNTDTASNLYIKFGTTATTASGGFNARLQPLSYYEVPFGYNGRIDGIWDGSPTGAASIGELT